MAAEEKTPLLNDDDDDYDQSNFRQRQNVKNVFKSDTNRVPENRTVHDIGRPQGNNRGNLSTSSSQNTVTHFNDQIVSVFIVAFDTKAGNIIEWCQPEESDLEGVEFKAMTSGSHKLSTDFVYFRKGNLFGLACFENMKVESEIERGARMKSVGILATCYTLLYRHMQFLETQVRHQLEIPCQYRQLEAFWEDKKATLPLSQSNDSLRIYSPGSTPLSDIMPEMKITHPAGCFSQFIQFFGEQIFVLWKFALLGKRIIFFSPPPIGVVCYRVYCSCCLAHHDLQQQFPERSTQPFFYVNVADIETLESEVSYIACTTEKIFEIKRHIYDVYVDNQMVKTSSEHLKELLKTNAADRAKLQLLNNQRQRFGYGMNGYDNSDIDEEETVTMFFTEQNNRLFHTLLEVSQSADRTLTADHMKDMGLDPQADRAFIMELLEAYGIDVMLVVDNPCCPR